MSERNQCDGCALGMVVNENGNHVNASGRTHMDCTRDRYEASETEQLRARVAELEAALRSARSELAVLASYANNPATEWPNIGLRMTAKAHAAAIKDIDAVLREAGEGEVHQTAEGGKCRTTCRTVTQRVNSDWCIECRREMERRAETETLPFCACGRRISECDGSRAGCGKSPSIRARGESLTEAPSPMRHVVNEHGDCAHWCEACYHERRARGES